MMRKVTGTGTEGTFLLIFLPCPFTGLWILTGLLNSLGANQMARPCYVAGFSFIETCHFPGKLLNTEGKQLTISSGSPWNRPDSLSPSLPQNKEDHKVAKKTLRPEHLLKRPLSPPAPGKLPRRGLDQLSHLERTLFNLLSCLQAMQHTPGLQLGELTALLR